MLQGKLGVTDGGVATIKYLGVPYGQPPIGDRRFLVALPANPWPDVFNAIGDITICHRF